MNADYENGQANSGDSLIQYKPMDDSRVYVDANARLGDFSVVHKLDKSDDFVADSMRLVRRTRARQVPGFYLQSTNKNDCTYLLVLGIIHVFMRFR